MTVILASQSPRRRQLLGQMGFTDFKICPARGEEVAAPGLTPAQLVEALSSQKAAEVAAAAEADALIIAADTVVAVDDRVLGKPHSEEEAAEMLLSLSGREHTVYTGVTLRRGSQIVTRHEATQVRFRSLTREEIDGILTGIRDNQMSWIADRKQRTAQFQQILSRRDIGELVLLARCLHLQQRERPLPTAERETLHQIEHMIEQEFSIVLGLPPTEVGAYIQSKMPLGETV